MSHGYAHMPADVWIEHLILFVLAIVLVFEFGVLLHESTHWLVAWVLDADVKNVSIGVFSGHVEYELPADAPRWKPIAINISPRLIGVLVILPYMVWLWFEGANLEWMFIVFSFFTSYSLLGSAGDLLPAVSRAGGRVWEPSREQQGQILGAGMAAGGFISILAEELGFGQLPWGAEWGLLYGGLAIVLILLFAEHQEEWQAD